MTTSVSPSVEAIPVLGTFSVAVDEAIEISTVVGASALVVTHEAIADVNFPATGTGNSVQDIAILDLRNVSPKIVQCNLNQYLLEHGYAVAPLRWQIFLAVQHAQALADITKDGGCIISGTRFLDKVVWRRTRNKQYLVLYMMYNASHDNFLVDCMHFSTRSPVDFYIPAVKLQPATQAPGS
jgi:hypothetical protein